MYTELRFVEGNRGNAWQALDACPYRRSTNDFFSLPYVRTVKFASQKKHAKCSSKRGKTTLASAHNGKQLTCTQRRRRWRRSLVADRARWWRYRNSETVLQPQSTETKAVVTLTVQAPPVRESQRRQLLDVTLFQDVTLCKKNLCDLVILCMTLSGRFACSQDFALSNSDKYAAAVVAVSFRKGDKLLY